MIPYLLNARAWLPGVYLCNDGEVIEGPTTLRQVAYHQEIGVTTWTGTLPEKYTACAVATRQAINRIMNLPREY